MTLPEAGVVRRTAVVLRPDPARVITRVFLPGEELLASGSSRSGGVLQRVLALSDDEVTQTLEETVETFTGRHRDLTRTLEAHFAMVAHMLPDHDALSTERRRLIGAYFTQEYAIEAAALFNPSMVLHPDQSGVTAGQTRFLMSVRAVGEGHVSSIEFRTGTVDDDEVVVDEPGPLTALPALAHGIYDKSVFERQHAELGGDESNAAFVLKRLPARFTRAELQSALADLSERRLSRATSGVTVQRFEQIAACNYSVAFDPASPLDQRVIMPTGPSERHGMEDLRLVRFTDPDGRIDYRGIYTAFDGVRVVPQMLRTDDFGSFTVSQLSGRAAKNKGMVLFPRMVHGQYLALTRWDRESNALSASTSLTHWDDSTGLQLPRRPWGLIQLGNCGPPIETSDGWLVLTHGVGPMRQYGIGAMLLDLDDPREVLAQLDRPLILPASDERDGYVPNVVYSCGGLLEGQTVVLPYGCSDQTIRVALLDLPALLAMLTS